jgi:hypothetical protein
MKKDLELIFVQEDVTGAARFIFLTRTSIVMFATIREIE